MFYKCAIPFVIQMLYHWYCSPFVKGCWQALSEKQSIYLRCSFVAIRDVFTFLLYVYISDSPLIRLSPGMMGMIIPLHVCRKE